MDIKVLRRMLVQKKERDGRVSESHYTNTHTHTHTHTHPEAHFISLVFLRKCRNKTKNHDV